MNFQIICNRFVIGSLLVAIVLLPNILAAQKYDSEYDYIKKTFKVDKKNMVEKFLILPEDEAARFWPLYDEYEEKRAELGQERFESLQKYMEDYEKMNDEKSSEWLKKIFGFNNRFDDMIKVYTEQIETKLGGRRAIQFYEIETFFNLEIRSWIYSEFPLVGEKDR